MKRRPAMSSRDDEAGAGAWVLPDVLPEGRRAPEISLDTGAAGGTQPAPAVLFDVPQRGLTDEEHLILPQRLCAIALHVSPSTVSRWPVQPVRREGRETFYDIRELIAWRERQPFGGEFNPTQARARQHHYLAEKLKHDVERLDSETIRTDEAEEMYREMVARATVRFRRVPNELAPMLVQAIDGDMDRVGLVAAMLSTLIEEALAELHRTMLFEQPRRRSKAKDG